MPEFNRTVKQRLAEALRGRVGEPPDEWFMKPDDLALSFDERGGFRAWYVFEPSFCFVCKTELGLDYEERFSIAAKPGELYDMESHECRQLSELVDAVRKWVARLDNELIARPEVRAIEDHARRLEALEQAVQQFPDEYPTRQEHEAMLKRLGEVEQLLTRHIREEADNDADAQKEVDRLRAEVEALRQSLSDLTQRGFVRWVGAKLFNFVRRPGAVTELTETLTAGKALVDSVVKDVLDK